MPVREAAPMRRRGSPRHSFPPPYKNRAIFSYRPYNNLADTKASLYFSLPYHKGNHRSAYNTDRISAVFLPEPTWSKAGSVSVCIPSIRICGIPQVRPHSSDIESWSAGCPPVAPCWYNENRCHGWLLPKVHPRRWTYNNRTISINPYADIPRQARRFARVHGSKWPLSYWFPHFPLISSKTDAVLPIANPRHTDSTSLQIHQAGTIFRFRNQLFRRDNSHCHQQNRSGSSALQYVRPPRHPACGNSALRRLHHALRRHVRFSCPCGIQCDRQR